MINWLKVVLIRLTDFINRFEPFDEFTRPVQPKYPETLEDKAIKFENDLERFWVDGFLQYNLPPNSGDQCLWHGMYTALSALRYSVKGTEGSLHELKCCVSGLRRHQRRGYEDDARLIRGCRADGSFEDEVSNDQATGHLLGIYFLWRYGDIECRAAARDLIAGLADELLDHNYALINAQGQPTKHGQLIQGVKTDPLNLTLCLAILRAAEAMTHDPAYLWHYNKLVELYKPILPYANVRLLWWAKTHHAHRAAIHYSILCDLEDEHDIHRLYLKGLIRTWKMERKAASPWIYYLVRRQVLVDPADLQNCLKHLNEMTLEDKRFNAEKINSVNAEFWRERGIKFFKWGKHLRASQPLPRHFIGSQDFHDQRHPYAVDDWVGNGTGNIQHNGMDYLICYYGLKSLRLL